ncbi:MAG: MarR family transcriptional regulator [Acidobacteriota bacterium]
MVKKQAKPEVELTEKSRELMAHIDQLVRDSLLAEKSGDLSRIDTKLLRLLSDAPLSMSDISSRLDVALSSATGLVDRLVRGGLAARERPPENRRTVRVTLTARGRRANDRIGEARTAFGLAMLEPLSRSERESLLDLFRKMTGSDDD